MKKLKKFLLAFFVILSITAIPVFADETEQETMSEEELQAYYEQLMGSSQSMDEQLKIAAEQMFEGYFSMASDDELSYYSENTVGVLNNAIADYKNYLENDTLGDYVGIKGSMVEEIKNGYSVIVEGEYEKVNLKMTMEWKTIGGQLTPVKISFSTEDKVKKTTLDKLKTAGINTIIGVATVFVILILISFVISRFKYISQIEQKRTKKREEQVAALDAPENVTAQIVQKENKEEAVDDLELVAVITAAICAATGASSDSFVVRSIRKSKRR